MKRPPDRHRDNATLAVCVIVFTTLSLSFGDALIKKFSADFVLWQIFVMRSVIAAPVLAAVIRLRFVSLKPRNPGWTAPRSLMLVFMWIAYYTALPHLPLAVAAAVYYTLPLFITLFAALFVGDKISAKGWVAVVLGFGAVLLILRPQADDFNAYALLPLAAAVLYALAMLLTRTKCRNEDPLVLAFWLNVSFIGVGIMATPLLTLWSPSEAEIGRYPFLLDGWVSMGANEWLAMAVLATAIIIASAGTAIAYQLGPLPVVATFDFAYLAFAVIWGMVFFAETPDAVTVFGMILLTVAGVLAIRQ